MDILNSVTMKYNLKIINKIFNKVDINIIPNVIHSILGRQYFFIDPVE